MENNEKKISEEAIVAARVDIVPKPYHKPLLEELGDLRTLTLGGTTAGPDFSGPQTGPFTP